jgi:DNA-directed RNA polymerase subunit M/transcription elongation factor TFIIS
MIEFSCPTCGKVLKTADDKAGVQAKCPGCGEVVTVPHASVQAAGGISTFEESPADDMKTCPMCGQQIKAAAVKCRYCGEDLSATVAAGERGKITPSIIDAGNVLSRTWEIYKPQMGITIGGFAITWFLGQLAGAPAQIVNILMDPNIGVIDRDLVPVMVLLFIVLTFASWAVSIYLTLGQSLLMLKIARGEQVEISEVFRGGRFFWRGLGSALLFALMIAGGFIACIVPGIILSLMFFPFMFVLVDQDCGVMDTLKTARSVTRGNLLTIFVLGLAGFGLTIAGLLAFCVGIFLVAPYLVLMQAVMYVMMSGQPLARPAPAAAT